MKIISILKGKWWIFALVLIFLYSYYIRAFNVVPDRLLSFDPILQYRFTKYLADWGHLPVWDELAYYVGVEIKYHLSPPIMFYITAVIYWLIKYLGLSLSLMTVASYMSAIYGAMIVFPTFLLGNELTNKYGGLLASVLIGTAPQILIRTFGSSYDTDQIVLFFLILTLYLGFFALKKRKVYSYCLALMGFSGFLLTWGYSFYSFFILVAFVMIYFVLNSLIGKDASKNKRLEVFRKIMPEIKDFILVLIILLIGLAIFAFINGENILLHISNVISFAQSAEEWIVNISIAELQLFDIFNIEGLIVTTGRFVTGDSIINISIITIFIILIAAGFLLNYKKRNIRVLSILTTLLLIGIYTTFRGIRFTEFTSAIFIVIIAAGFGALADWVGNDALKKAFIVGVGLFLAFNAFQISMDMGKSLGPDINSNWDTAWNFLKTQTPEFSIVGTWWDPGHMITGLADRRDFADGGHCHNDCLYTINDRITDIGKIMATNDENVSMNLIRKYQGDSPKVYWIASDDLIGKFQWVQYFGTGCDARTEQRCPLYIQIPEQSRSTDANGNIILRNYGNIMVFQGLNIPIPIYVQGINGAIFDETMFYSNGEVNIFKMNESEREVLIQSLKPLEKQLNFRFTNQSIPLTVWIPQHYAYIVIIPQNLRDSVFTKMFMLEGQGLEHFKQVFRNEQVKIYEVI